MPGQHTVRALPCIKNNKKPLVFRQAVSYLANNAGNGTVAVWCIFGAFLNRAVHCFIKCSLTSFCIKTVVLQRYVFIWDKT